MQPATTTKDIPARGTTIRADPELIAALDAEVERRNASRKGPRYTRSDLVREFVLDGLGRGAESPAKD